MKKIPYLEILKQSFFITWKNKFLWIFGFFVSLGSFSSNFNLPSDSEKSKSDVVLKFIENHPGIFAGIIITLVVLAIIFFVLRIIGIAALTKAANNIAVYSQSTIKSLFLEAKEYFWRLFLIKLLIGVALVVLIIVLAVPALYMFSADEKIFGAILLLIALLIFIPIVVIAVFIGRFGTFYVVLGNMKVMASLESAYSMFKKNIKESLIMWFIDIAASMLMFMSVMVCVLIALLIFAPFGIVAYFVFSKIGILVVGIVAAIFVVFALLVLSSWYAFFVQTMWVLFFQQIVLEKKDEKNIAEKIEAKVEVTSPEAV